MGGGGAGADAAVPLLEARRSSGGGAGATWAQTLGNVVVSIVGTGVLGLPYAFRIAGWAAGSLGVAAAGLATYYCMTLLIECRNRLEEENASVQIHSYGDLGERAFGARGRFLTEVLVLVSQAGGAIAYLVFIGQNLSSVFSAPDHHQGQRVAPSAFIFLLLLPLEIALSSFRTLSAIAPFSALADACNVLAMGIVIKDDVQLLLGDPSRAPPGGRPAFRSAWGLPFAVGTAVFCFEGFSMTLPLEASMAEREMFRWVLSRAFLGITVAYASFGVFGYLAYGDLTCDIITLNLPNDWSAAAVKVGLCVALAFTFPVMMHPIHEIAESRLRALAGWFRKPREAQTTTTASGGPRRRRWCCCCCWSSSSSSSTSSWACLHLARALTVAATAVLASLVPGFGAFISFVGGTVCALLSFVLPAVFHLKFVGPSLGLGRRALDYALLLLGSLFAAYETYATAVST